MLIEDLEKLIKELRDEKGLNETQIHEEIHRICLEEEGDDMDIECAYDRPMGGLPLPPSDILEGENDEEKVE